MKAMKIGDEASLLEEDHEEGLEGEEEEDSEVEGVNEDDEAMIEKSVEDEFKAADMNGNGFLEADEMKSMLKRLEAPDHVDWLQSDLDKDGKISVSELVHLTKSHSEDGEDKDPDSPEDSKDGERKDPNSPEASKDGEHKDSHSPEASKDNADK